MRGDEGVDVNETIEWISVDERLPEYDGSNLDLDTLVYIPGKKPFVVTFAFGRSDCWIDRDGDRAEGVTHWAAMPKGPIANG